MDRRLHLAAGPGEQPSWVLAQRAAHPALWPHVRQYQGYLEPPVAGTLERIEPPHGEVTLIVNLGDHLSVASPGDRALGLQPVAFLAGVHGFSARTRNQGRSAGIHVRMGAMAAAALMGVPGADIANRTFALEDVLGRGVADLHDDLLATDDWAARFDRMDGFLRARLERGRPLDRGVQWALDRLVATAGAVPIEALATEIGWSRRHLARRFAAEIGLSPKLQARILRFRRAADLLRAGHGAATGLADLAVDCGFFDQAHMTREFRDLSGLTPAALAGRRLDGGGLSAA